MKFTVLLAIVGKALATTPSADSQVSSLKNDFHDFFKLIPVNKIMITTQRHLDNDTEFGNAVRYLQGDSWAKLVNEVKGKPEVQALNNYMKEAGLDITSLVEQIHKFIADLKPGTQPSKDRNIRSFLDEVEDQIPIFRIMQLMYAKIDDSKDFKNFYNRIQKAKKLFEEVRALLEVQRVSSQLKDMGVNVMEFIEVLYDLLGWYE